MNNKRKNNKEILKYYLHDESICYLGFDTDSLIEMILQESSESWKEDLEEICKTYDFMHRVILEIRKRKSKNEIKKILQSELYQRIVNDVMTIIFSKREFPMQPSLVAQMILNNLENELIENNSYLNMYDVRIK